jgi:IclR family transcriptional regulator, KDG regulon repressor
MDNTFGSLGKAIRILSLFDSERPELSAPEISEALSIPLSTTYKYLKVFLQNEILSKGRETGKFHPGFKLFKLGVLAAQNISLLKIARPYLEYIAKRSLETVVLAMSDGLDLLCVDTIESPRPVKLTMTKGTRLPLHAGAPGKVLLAHKDRSFVQELIHVRGLAKINRNTITDPEELEMELESIRRQGHGRSDSEVDPGAAALAVPVFDHEGLAPASVSLIGSAENLLENNSRELIRILKDAAGGISERLGYVPGKRGSRGITARAFSEP